MLGSYNKKKQSLITDPYGVCCIWNLHLQGRPEFVFQTQVCYNLKKKKKKKKKKKFKNIFFFFFKK